MVPDKNIGSLAYQALVGGALCYNGDSADPSTVEIIEGITEIRQESFAVVVVGNSSDVLGFTAVWGEVDARDYLGYRIIV